jgi:signal transduction histidine kinase
LGLAIVRNIAQLHGGDAQLQSSEQGNQFDVTLSAGNGAATATSSL